jgi:hypothetical protein
MAAIAAVQFGSEAAMRTIAITALSALVMLAAVMAHADNGGAVTAPAVGTASQAPPAAGAEIGVPQAQKPAIGIGGTSVDDATVAATVHGIDTSTAAPGGHAESTRNGALSTPADSGQTAEHHKKIEPPTGAGTEAPR